MCTGGYIYEKGEIRVEPSKSKGAIAQTTTQVPGPLNGVAATSSTAELIKLEPQIGRAHV